MPLQFIDWALQGVQAVETWWPHISRRLIWYEHKVISKTKMLGPNRTEPVWNGPKITQNDSDVMSHRQKNTSLSPKHNYLQQWLWCILFPELIGSNWIHSGNTDYRTKHKDPPVMLEHPRPMDINANVASVLFMKDTNNKNGLRQKKNE